MLGLTRAPARDLSRAVHAILDRRLRTDAAAPLALALSGGGDSVALTLMAAAWARDHGRRLILLNVDHRLRLESRGWAETCARLAQRLGLEFKALAWEGDKPVRGLPAAARNARHRLLADAARDVGAGVILLGHTASDVAEAEAMRASGSTTPSPREWAPSPVWPEGRGVFLLRPMLDLDRGELRAWLYRAGETWIDDPSNDDPRFARARARLAGASKIAEPPASADITGLARTVTANHAGVLSVPREALESEKLVAAACLCAAGTSTPPRRDRLERLMAMLQGGKAATATLCGARIETDGEVARFIREPGEMVRSGLPVLQLQPGASTVWDGRYEISSRRSVTIQALAGHAARLPPAQREALRGVPASARGSLPAVVTGDGVDCPVLAPVDGVTIRALGLDRLRAACGVVAREP